MKKLTLALAGILGLSQAVQRGGHHGGLKGGRHDRVDYDYTCEAQKLEHCLQTDISLYGPNVVLVNLDNRCQVEKYEREGIFLQSGDLLFVTGRANKCAW